jgi:1-acyl-sn-glycerol-3-phosphate acyltransferase
MHALAKPKNWKHLCVCSVDLAKIVLSNVGLSRKKPDYGMIFGHWLGLFGLLWDTDNKLIVRHGENIVREGPAIYVANHVRKSDALTVAYAVYLHAAGRQLHVMMRDDFFDDKSWARTPLLDVDKLAMSLGAIQVSRQSGAYSQMKRFIRLLLDDDCFIIFPTGTRSRSGHVMELPPQMLELGKTSFFAVIAQRERFGKHGGGRAQPVPMVPVGMSCDPVSGRIALVFGEPEYLAPDPPDTKIDRAVLSEFDQQLVRTISRLVEINLSHIAALYILHYAWHPGDLPDRSGNEIVLKRSVFTDDLTEIVQDIKKEDGLILSDSLKSELDSELRRVEKLFARRGMLKTAREELLLLKSCILSAPPVDHDYRKRNPVKYLANQVAHFDEIVSMVEARVLRTVGARH